MRSLRHPALISSVGAGKLSAAPPELGPRAVGGDVEAYILCLELCDMALDTVIKERRLQNRHFRSDEAGPLLAQVADGLAFLHGRGVLHRDLKAANVFLRRRPRCGAAERRDGLAEVSEADVAAFVAKLGDFGASKVGSRAQTPVQTPQWMAPEVARQEPYGRPADIWAFGMLMYELMELSVPYGEEITMPALEAELSAGRPPALSRASRARSPELVALMERCSAAAPEDRPTAAEVVASLGASGWSPERLL